jgi:hypothetical protein
VLHRSAREPPIDILLTTKLCLHVRSRMSPDALAAGFAARTRSPPAFAQLVTLCRWRPSAPMAGSSGFSPFSCLARTGHLARSGPVPGQPSAWVRQGSAGRLLSGRHRRGDVAALGPGPRPSAAARARTAVRPGVSALVAGGALPARSPRTSFPTGWPTRSCTAPLPWPRDARRVVHAVSVVSSAAIKLRGAPLPSRRWLWFSPLGGFALGRLLGPRLPGGPARPRSVSLRHSVSPAPLPSGGVARKIRRNPPSTSPPLAGEGARLSAPALYIAVRRFLRPLTSAGLLTHRLGQPPLGYSAARLPGCQAVAREGG